MKRTFTYTDDKSNKFWTIEITGNSYTVNYGKVGTAGQTQNKDFADETACQKAADKLIAEKTKKGYVEQTGGNASQQTAEPVAAKQKAPVKKAEETEPTANTSGLPYSFSCTVNIMKNGRAIEYRSLTVNWDPYDKVDDPGGILTRADRMHYKAMPTAQLAVIEALKIIAEKLSKGDKFSSCNIIKNGEKEEVGEEQLREWLKIATKNGKDTKVIFNLEKPGDVKRYENAIKNGDIEQVKIFIENGASVKSIKQSKGGFRPLDVAIEANQPAMVRFFIEKLGDKAYEGDDTTYFTSIAQNQWNDDREQQIRLLLDNGYDLTKDPTLAKNYTLLLLPGDLMEKTLNAIDLSNDDGRVLIKALANSYESENRVKYIIQLINKGANVKNAPDDGGETPLHWAAKKFGAELDLIKLLVEKGADPNAKDKDGKKPLDYAVNARPGWDGEVSDEVFRYLYSLTTGFKPDIFTVIKNLNERLDMVKLLLSKGADFNVKYKMGSSREDSSIWSTNYEGYTPLQFAEAKKYNNELIEYLRNNTTVPKLAPEQEKAILHHYFDTLKAEPMIESLKEALASGADPNVQNTDGDTFLHRVMQNASDLWKYVLEFIDMAVKNGADVNIRNNQGVTSLMLGMKAYKPEYIQRLLDAGADVNIQDNEGRTAVFYVNSSYFRCLLPILQTNPDLMLKNKKGVTAIDYLRSEHLYYTDGFVYQNRQEIKEAIDKLGLDLPTDQQLQGANWTPKPIELDKPLPAEYTQVSSYYFPFNDCGDEILHVGGNRLALIGGYPRVIQIFDTLKGRVIWGLNSAARMGYAIYDENRDAIYVARDGSSAANYITAHNPETGALLWKKECKLTNSSQQFGTHFVQNATHLIHANIRKGVLYFVNKDTGKLDAKLPLMHNVHCSADFTDKQEMFTRQNDLYVMGFDRQNDCFTVDRYDIATQTFVATIFTSAKGVSLLKFVENGEYLYLLANTGVIYKLSLPDGKIITQVAHDPSGEEIPANYWLKNLHRKGNRLSYHMRNYKLEKDTDYEYDLDTDTIIIPENKKEKAQKKKKPEYGKKGWLTIQTLTLGDSHFEIQKKSWTSDSKYCFLYRIS